MKKMLVLALVLAVAGLANASLDLKGAIAGLDYSVSGSTVTIKMTDNATTSGYNFALLADNGSVLSGSVVPAAKFQTAIAGLSLANKVWDGVSASIGTNSPATGEVYSINFAAGVQKIYFVYSSETFEGSSVSVNGTLWKLANDNEFSTAEGAIEGSTYYMVPEPMTMGLLALGALFLRKK